VGRTGREIWQLLVQTYESWTRHDATQLGAAIAFYTTLSLSPLLVLVMGGLSLFFNRTSAQAQILGQVQELIGAQGAETVKGVLEHAGEPASFGFAAAAGILTLLIGASGVFGELRSALNRIHEVRAKSGGWMSMLKDKVFLLGLVLAAGFLLVVSLFVSAWLNAAGDALSGALPLPKPVLLGLNCIVSFAGIAILFGCIFRFVPDDRDSWRSIAIGSAVTSLLFAIGKFAIGIYLGKAAVGSAYGAAGSLVVLIVWVYYSSLLFLFGAALTHCLSERERRVIVSSE